MTDPAAATRRRGRPRAADRDQRIIDATHDLLHEVGFDRLRMQDVAERAGVGLATIYRRWPTKQKLVIETMSRGSGMLDDVPRTGDPRADLEALLRVGADEVRHKEADLLPGMLVAIREDPELAAAFREHILGEIRAAFRPLVAAVLGDDHPELDIRADLAPALLLFRLTMAGEEPSEALIRQVADLMLGERRPPDL